MSLVLGKNPSNELKEIELTNSGLLKIDVAGSSGTVSANVDVTGNTVGLSTTANQTTMISSLGTLAGAVSGNEMQCDIITSALPTGAATESTLSSVQTNTATLAGAVSGTEFQCDVVTSALPTGAATSALQTTGNTSLAAIDTSTTSIDTSCVGIASDCSGINGKISQGYDATIASGGNGAQQVLLYGRDTGGNLDALLVNASGELKVASSASGASTTNNTDTLAPGAGGTATSTAQDMDGFTNLTIFGTSTNTSDNIEVQVSHNNSTWIPASEYFISTVPSGSDVAFSVRIANEGARYWRVQQVDTLSTAFTLTVQSSKK